MTFIKLRQVSKRYKDEPMYAVASFDLEINKGEIITLLGPSGSGKTTSLRMIAGFEQPTSGEIIIGNTVVSSDTTLLPPEKRGIGMVFQDYALFPHLTVEKNVMFGLSGLKGAAKKKRIKEVLDLVSLEEYAHRYPHELSGGQQQRVALARALAPEPQVILMDEPFSNLDASLREKMRSEIQTILRKAKTTAILVTHDQKDAFAVSDRVVVMNEGVIQQVAAPREMYRCPRNCFVAQFLGKTNFISGKQIDNDLKHVYTHIGKVCLPEKTQRLFDNVMLSIRPEGCKIIDEGKYCGEVENVIYGGDYQELVVRMKTQDNRDHSMIIHAPIDQDIEHGQIISFDIAPELVALVEQ